MEAHGNQGLYCALWCSGNTSSIAQIAAKLTHRIQDTVVNRQSRHSFFHSPTFSISAVYPITHAPRVQKTCRSVRAPYLCALPTCHKILNMENIQWNQPQLNSAATPRSTSLLLQTHRTSYVRGYYLISPPERPLSGCFKQPPCSRTTQFG